MLKSPMSPRLVAVRALRLLSCTARQDSKKLAVKVFTRFVAASKVQRVVRPFVRRVAATKLQACWRRYQVRVFVAKWHAQARVIQRVNKNAFRPAQFNKKIMRVQKKICAQNATRPERLRLERAIAKKNFDLLVDLLFEPRTTDTLRKLKDIGFTAGQAKRRNFSLHQSKEVGYSARELKESAEYGVEALVEQGFSLAQLRTGGFSVVEIINGGLMNNDLEYKISAASKEIEKAHKLPSGGASWSSKRTDFPHTADLVLSAGAAIVTTLYLTNKWSDSDTVKNCRLDYKDVSGSWQQGTTFLSRKTTDRQSFRISSGTSIASSQWRLVVCDTYGGYSCVNKVELKGCTATELRAAGFSAQDLMNAGGFPANDLVAAFSLRKGHRFVFKDPSKKVGQVVFAEGKVGTITDTRFTNSCKIQYVDGSRNTASGGKEDPLDLIFVRAEKPHGSFGEKSDVYAME